MKTYGAIIIGGGSAGIAAAVSAFENGLRDILILERDAELGGILHQCIHNGFGLHMFKEELTGPTYAERWIDKLIKTGVSYKTNSMVLHISKDKVVEYVNEEEGYVRIQGQAIILAMGSVERTRGAIGIPGYRPAGIWSAGTAQRYLNMEGYMVGRRIFILGSGDIGLIMARRMTLEGAEVLGVAEVMPYSNGLKRNVKQCLSDFDIPLLLSHTVTNIYGKDRVSCIEVSEVDEKRKPIAGTEKRFEVDTLLLSVGLIPDNRLSEEAGITLSQKTKGAVVDEELSTSVPGIFACGNVLHIHDLVDFVSMEGMKAGKAAAEYVRRQKVSQMPKSALQSTPQSAAQPTPQSEARTKLHTASSLAPSFRKVIPTKAGAGITYVLPQRVHADSEKESVEFMFRSDAVYRNALLSIYSDGKQLKSIKKKILLPAEMEKVTLTPEELGLAEKELSFEIIIESKR